jgi:hypothetical protein
MIEVPGRSGMDVRVFDVRDVRPCCGMIIDLAGPSRTAHGLGRPPEGRRQKLSMVSRS